MSDFYPYLSDIESVSSRLSSALSFNSLEDFSSFTEDDLARRETQKTSLVLKQIDQVLYNDDEDDSEQLSECTVNEIVHEYSMWLKNFLYFRVIGKGIPIINKPPLAEERVDEYIEIHPCVNNNWVQNVVTVLHQHIISSLFPYFKDLLHHYNLHISEVKSLTPKNQPLHLPPLPSHPISQTFNINNHAATNTDIQTVRSFHDNDRDPPSVHSYFRRTSHHLPFLHSNQSELLQQHTNSHHVISKHLPQLHNNLFQNNDERYQCKPSLPKIKHLYNKNNNNNNNNNKSDNNITRPSLSVKNNDEANTSVHTHNNNNNKIKGKTKDFISYNVSRVSSKVSLHDKIPPKSHNINNNNDNNINNNKNDSNDEKYIPTKFSLSAKNDFNKNNNNNNIKKQTFLHSAARKNKTTMYHLSSCHQPTTSSHEACQGSNINISNVGRGYNGNNISSEGMMEKESLNTKRSGSINGIQIERMSKREVSKSNGEERQKKANRASSALLHTSFKQLNFNNLPTSYKHRHLEIHKHRHAQTESRPSSTRAFYRTRTHSRLEGHQSKHQSSILPNIKETRSEHHLLLNAVVSTDPLPPSITKQTSPYHKIHTPAPRQAHKHTKEQGFVAPQTKPFNTYTHNTQSKHRRRHSNTSFNSTFLLAKDDGTIKRPLILRSLKSRLATSPYKHNFQFGQLVKSRSKYQLTI